MFYHLKIKNKIQETGDTVSLVFDVPSHLEDTFDYQAGQYLTLKFSINDQEARRAYSMSSSPKDADIKVTIKRVEGGLVSNYIHDSVQIGDTIDVMAPQGRFVAKINETNRKTYYLLGSGSGITPLMSILKTILEDEAQSSVFLFYGSRNEQQIIFKNELEELEQKYKGQLFVEHILSQPKQEKASGIGGLFGKKKTLWLGKKGRIDRKHTAEYLEKNIPPYPKTEYFICGPGNMINTVKDVLIARGVSDKSIHFELFNSNTPGDGVQKGKVSSASSSSSKAAIIHLDGKVFNLDIPSDKTVLQSLLDAGHEPPYSCTTGSCSTCIAKVLNGGAMMDVCYALDDDEVEEGYILTCQAKVTSNDIEIDYSA